VFIWKDFQAKNNNELLANLGNFANRLLKFVVSYSDNEVPEYLSVPRHDSDQAFVASLQSAFTVYLDNLEQVKLKDGLKAAMEVSRLCNAYF